MKKFCVLIFLILFSFSGNSWASDLWHIYTNPNDDEENEEIYSRYGNDDIDFYYQLRDISGSGNDYNVAGPQWFATVYENYFYNLFNNGEDDERGYYRRTMGGETPVIPISFTADLLNGFDYTFAYEPQVEYNLWLNRIDSRLYDIYPDPVESLCIVTTNGTANFNISFENPYSRHFPYWWGPTYNYINAPIAYTIQNNNTIYNGETGELLYTIITNDSGDQTICNTDEEVVYIISGDNRNEIYNTDLELVYTFGIGESYPYPVGYNEAPMVVYNSDGEMIYTIENFGENTSYICELRNILESFAPIEIDGYSGITITPDTARQVHPGDSQTFRINATVDEPDIYGSKLGYIALRQEADFARGYTGYRESSLLPVVIANVSDGDASENPLYFDMLIFDNNDIVRRVNFRWDVVDNKPDQDLGTFFMMRNYNTNIDSFEMPSYELETRITNRTGTRYRLYRYDEIGNINGDNTPRAAFREIRPDYWKYDLTPDLYGTLPERFHLDAHSQIAPGLVTVYRENVGDGYSTINTANDTSESFRLYEYSTNSSPKDLRLRYKRITGMTTSGNKRNIYSNNVEVQGFRMNFADIRNDSTNTERQLENLMGKPVRMIPSDSSSNISISGTDINSRALYAFEFNRNVPGELISMDDEISEDAYIALQPIQIRFKISRQNSLLVDHWDELERAERSGNDTSENSRALLNAFSRFGTVMVRSDITDVKDTNLFTSGALNEVGLSNLIKAFTYNNNLYLDFMVFIADAESTRDDFSAFIKTFTDDNVPYILIGDGRHDDRWNLKFFIGQAGANPELIDNNNTSSEPTPIVNPDGEGGGGGCNFGMNIFVLVLFIISATLYLKKQN